MTLSRISLQSILNSENCLNSFSNGNDVGNLHKELSCFKNPSNTSGIGLLLTRCLKCFQNTSIVETEIYIFINWSSQY